MTSADRHEMEWEILTALQSDDDFARYNQLRETYTNKGMASAFEAIMDRIETNGEGAVILRPATDDD